MSGIPEITPSYVGFAPVVDGKVHDETWNLVPYVTGFELLGSAGPASQQTRMKMCYDRKNIYLMFECFEDRMDSLVTRFTEDHSPVWQDDSVEVFICPYAVAGEPRCHQFVVNAAGARAYIGPGLQKPPDTWRAAATGLPDRWVAEMSIPLDILRPAGRNEPYWRVNFGRNEMPHNEMSSWSGVPRWYRTYSRFGRMIAPQAPFAFNTFRGPLSRLEPGSTEPAGARPVTAPATDLTCPDVVLPEPREIHRRLKQQPFEITASTRIAVTDRANEADMWAVDEINDHIEKLGGKRLDTVHSMVLSKDPSQAVDLIVIGETESSELLRAICNKGAIRMPRYAVDKGAHVVDVLPSRVVVMGESQVDTFYAAQTLKHMMRVRSDGSIYVNSQTVHDYPRMGFRGVHLLASRDALSFLGKLIENVLAPLKVNHIVLQTDKVVWKSHPEVTDPNNSMSQEDVKKLLEIARRHHIAVTPMVQSPGHLEWAFRGGANLEFAEDPEDPYCYCMSNPKSYEFIFDIMDEAIELFGQPEYFHAGRDEFDMRGNMPVDETCKAIGKERLYIQDTLKVYEHLKSRGCKVMMWGDILTKPGFRELVDELPKDILINDWRYSPSQTYPTVDFYQEHGFPVVGGTWYDPRNIYYFCRYADKRKIDGMLHTTWTGFESEEAVLRKYPEQAYAYVLAGIWMWNPLRPHVDNLPFKPKAYFDLAWSEHQRGGSDFAVVDLKPYCNISRADSGRAVGWLGVGREQDLHSLPSGTIGIGGVPYEILPAAVRAPAAVMLGGEGAAESFPVRIEGVKVGSKARALHFLQACAYTADAGATVARYIVRYADGRTAEIPLVYNHNIYSWDDESLGMSYGFAWRNRAASGRTVGLCDLVWSNSWPDTRIESIDLVSTGTEASPFVVAVTAEM